MKRLVRGTVILVVVMAILALASYLTTREFRGAAFRQGVFHILVRDSDGKPVATAVLKIYKGGTRDLAFDFPFANHTASKNLIADEDGQLTAIQDISNWQFSVQSWQLFWMFPMGGQFPKFDCEISAPGFKTYIIDVSQLLDAMRLLRAGGLVEAGNPGRGDVLAVYSHTVYLEK